MSHLFQHSNTDRFSLSMSLCLVRFAKSSVRTIMPSLRFLGFVSFEKLYDSVIQSISLVGTLFILHIRQGKKRLCGSMVDMDGWIDK